MESFATGASLGGSVVVTLRAGDLSRTCWDLGVETGVKSKNRAVIPSSTNVQLAQRRPLTLSFTRPNSLPRISTLSSLVRLLPIRTFTSARTPSTYVAAMAVRTAAAPHGRAAKRSRQGAIRSGSRGIETSRAAAAEADTPATKFSRPGLGTRVIDRPLRCGLVRLSSGRRSIPSRSNLEPRATLPNPLLALLGSGRQ